MSENKQPAGTIKKIEDNPKAQALPEPEPRQSANGLRAMDEKAVNDYLESLMQARQPPPELQGVELTALTGFKEISSQQANTERRLTRAQADVEQLRAAVSRLQGQSEAYVNMLVMAEDARRAEAQAH